MRAAPPKQVFGASVTKEGSSRAERVVEKAEQKTGYANEVDYERLETSRLGSYLGR